MEDGMEIPLKTRKKSPYDSAILLRGIYPEETKTEKDTCTPMFIATLFTKDRTWEKPRCPLTNEWIKYVYRTYIHMQWNITQS